MAARVGLLLASLPFALSLVACRPSAGPPAPPETTRIEISGCPGLQLPRGKAARTLTRVCAAERYEAGFIGYGGQLSEVWAALMEIDDELTRDQMRALANAERPATRAYGRALLRGLDGWTCELTIEAFNDTESFEHFEDCRMDTTTGAREGERSLELSADAPWSSRVRAALDAGESLTMKMCASPDASPRAPAPTVASVILPPTFWATHLEHITSLHW